MKSAAGRPSGSHPRAGAEDAPDHDGRVSRKERELLRHRTELLEATERLLREKPLHELTVQHIAAESEFSVGYIYRLFDNKSEIIAALVTERLRELRALVDESLGAAAHWERRAGRLLQSLSDWFERTPSYGARVTPHLKDFARTHPAVAAETAAFLEFYKNSIERLFSEAIDSGQLCEDEPGELARVFRALVTGFSEEALLYRPEHPGSITVDAPVIMRVIKRAFAPRGGDS
jgi:AcrR family transcriptional regulator